MSKLSIVGADGKAQGECEIADELLETRKGTQALHESVVAYMAAQRRGTASTKSKGEVAGSNAKPWAQKGTGRARAGYRQSPIWRGGAVAFGPRPRSYAKKVNKKTARLALRRALGGKIADGQVRVVDQLTVDEPRTKTVVAMLKALDVTSTALIVVAKMDNNLVLAARNIPRVEVITAAALAPYHIVRYAQILVAQPAVEILTGRLSGEGVEVSS